MIRRFGFFVLAAAALALFAGIAARASAAVIPDIKSRGTLNVGVKADVLDFGYKNPKTNQFEGYEIDIAHEIAKRLLGDPNKINFTPVTAKTRNALLDSGELDFVIATFTITEARKKILDFSPPYFTDGIALLVFKDAGIKGLKDLGGKTIGVAKGADTATRLTEKGKDAGVTFDTAAFETYPEILAALEAGRVQAFSTDGSILKYYEEQDKKTVILPDRYSNEDYGIATKKGNDDLRDFIAGVITDMQKSGALKKLQQKWGIYTENQASR
jgi:putative glutamine transport system substrate-binding protein